MPCKYFAPNGKPSQLFDKLFQYYSTVQKFSPKKAELMAVTSWLATRSKAFSAFAGTWTEETTEPVSQVLDENREPEMVYMGTSERFRSLPLKDWKSYFFDRGWDFTPEKGDNTFPCFVSLKNPKLVEVTGDFTKDEFLRHKKDMKEGSYDGVIFIHTAKDGTVEKHYVVDNVEQIQTVYDSYGRNPAPNTEFKEFQSRFLLDDVQNDLEPQAKASSYLLPDDNTYRVLQTITKGEDEDLSKIARGILIKAGQNIPIKLVQSSAINYNNNAIEVGEYLETSRDSFNNLIVTETLKAYLTREAESGNLETLDNLVAAAPKIFANKEVPASYLASPAAYINAYFSDKDFYQLHKDTNFPGTLVTMSQMMINQIGDVFDFRKSYGNIVAGLIGRNQAIRQRSGPVLFQQDPGEASETTDGEEAPIKPKKEINLNAPYAHLLTGDSLLDKHIAAIFEKIQGIRGRLNRRAKPSEAVKVRGDLAKYQKELDSLVEQRSVGILINIGQREMMRMKNALDRSLSHNEIWENINLVESWIDFSSNFDKENADPNTLYAIRNISINAIEMYNTYSQLYWNSMTAAMADEGVPQRYLDQISPDKVIEDIGSGAANFVGLSFGEHGLEVGADVIIRQSANAINQEMLDFQTKLREKLDKLGSKDISFMFQKDDTGRYRPVTTYKTELYEKVTNLRKEIQGYERERRPLQDQLRELNNQYREAVRAKDKNEMLRLNSQIDQVKQEIETHKQATKSYNTLNEFMRDNFEYNLGEEGRKEYEEFAEILKEAYYDYNPETGEMEFSELRYNYDLAQYNPDTMLEWLDGKTTEYPRFAAKYFAIKPKAQWVNPDVKKFSGAQQDFYDFFTTQFLAAQANIPMDYSFTDYDADKLLREFAYMDAKTLSKFEYIGKEVKEFIQDIATVKYFDQDISYDRTAPFSKRQVKKLKFKPVSEFTKGTDGYWKEEEELPTALKEGLKEGRYKYKDGYLVVSSQGTQNEKLVKKIISKDDDPLSIFTNFIKFSLAYKYKSNVQDTLNGIQELAYATPKESEKNKGVTNPLGLRFGAKNGSNIEKRLGYTIDTFMTGNLKDPLPGTATGKPGERVFSAGQLIDSLNNFTRIRQLGLNPVSGISNLSIGTASNFIFAARNEFFNEKELREAYGIIKNSIASFYTGGKFQSGSSRKIAMIMEKFNMLGNLQEQFYMDKEWLEKAFEHMYIFQKGGEYINQGAVLIAMMRRQKIMVDGKEVRLWDAFEDKNGKLEFKYPDNEYATQQKQFVFGEGAKKVIKEIHGDYDILNPMHFKKQVWGRVGMLFRTWMPQAIKQRLGKTYVDYQLSELKGETVYRKGRWRSAGTAFNIFKPGRVDQLTNASRIMLFLGSIAANTISNNASRKIVDKMNLDNTDRMNMYANVKEAWWLTVISVATALMIRSFKSDDDDDDDPVTQSMLKYLYNHTSRVESELWFFYDPISFSKIFRDAVPMWSTFKQAARVWDASKTFIFDHENDVYQRGFRKGDSKFATQLQLFFPVSKQVQSIWSMGSQLYSDKYY